MRHCKMLQAGIFNFFIKKQYLASQILKQSNMTNEVALKQFNKIKNQHLFLSIILDMVGMLTYLIPLLGEVGDVIFAPFYGLVIFIMYRRRMLSAAIGGTTGLIEELLPETDIIPTATIMWIYTYIMRKDKTLNDFVKEKNKEIEALNNLKQLD